LFTRSECVYLLTYYKKLNFYIALMKNLEVLSIVLFLIGLTFKIFHWAGANVLLIMSASILSMLYFATSYILFNNIKLRDFFKRKTNIINPSGSKTALLIFTGVSLSALIIGLLFSLMIWPGAMVQITIGFFSGLICLSFLLSGYLSGDKTYRWTLYRAVPLVLISGIFYLFPNSWINYHYDIDHKSRDLLIEMRTNPNDTALSKKFRDRKTFYRDSFNNAQ
jgi:uncharacterized membrane protein